MGFGGAAISGEGRGYGFGSMSREQALRLLRESFDHGVNLYDFAPIYGHRLAQKRAGEAFAKCREKVILVSKFGVDWHDNLRVNMSNDPAIAVKMLDQTLHDFQSDYVDIYMSHWPDPNVDIRRPLELLQKSQSQGKIKHIGLCNTTEEDLMKAKEVAPIDVVQMEVNLFCQNSFEPLSPHLSEDVFKIGYSPLQKGILAASVTPDRVFEKDDCRSWAPWWKKSDWKKKALFAQAFMQNNKLTASEMTGLSLGFAHSLCDSVLCGMKTSQQLEKNLELMFGTMGDPKQMESLIERAACEFSSR